MQGYGGGPSDGRRPRFWAQVVGAVFFYAAYAVIRDVHGGSGTAHAALARTHGLAILHLEQRLHLDLELSLQRAALHCRPLVLIMDCFYGSLHFVLTWTVFFSLLRWAPRQTFRRARNALAISTGIALVCFFIYPTSPPRLLPPSYGYQDTLQTVGGLWSYNNGVLEHISDPFAAMPSLHIVWAGWCVLALGGMVRSRRKRALLALYPLCTGFTVLVTGTHWLLDLLAGVLVLAVAWWASALPLGGHDSRTIRLRRKVAPTTNTADPRPQRTTGSGLFKLEPQVRAIIDGWR
ncbi:MAG: superfamily [Pseudonocardiales bacterium]|nr:superfamily [Pseudonocardiales bacterium]